VPVSMSFAGGETRTIVDGLYFYDRGAPPELSVFERVLFPVLFSSRGGHGSEWLSEAAIANPRPWYVETVNEVMPFVCITYPCGERMAPSSTVAFDGMGYPQGIALIVPRAEADDLTFSLRVRDTARHAEGYGTQIPVVRESDMFRNAELTLLDLPVDPRYRTKIRMYVFDSGDHDAYVTVRQAHGVIDTRFVPVRRDCTSGDCAGAPWYGELDLAAGNTGDRVDVYITIGGTDTPAWAFASVTNNDTQQVTIVTPDGAGGRPGPDYEVWR